MDGTECGRVLTLSAELISFDELPEQIFEESQPLTENQVAQNDENIDKAIDPRTIHLNFVPEVSQNEQLERSCSPNNPMSNFTLPNKIEFKFDSEKNARHTGTYENVRTIPFYLA